MKMVLEARLYDAAKLHQELSRYIDQYVRVVVSFEGMDSISPSYLDTAIGQLYYDFPSKQIHDHLSVRGLDERQIESLRRKSETISKANDIY